MSRRTRSNQIDNDLSNRTSIIKKNGATKPVANVNKSKVDRALIKKSKKTTVKNTKTLSKSPKQTPKVVKEVIPTGSKRKSTSMQERDEVAERDGNQCKRVKLTCKAQSKQTATFEEDDQQMSMQVNADEDDFGQSECETDSDLDDNADSKVILNLNASQGENSDSQEKVEFMTPEQRRQKIKQIDE